MNEKHTTRALVVSDSHGLSGALSNILMAAEAAGPIDAVIHLGDGYRDLAPFSDHLPPVYQVAGNCDLGRTDAQDVVCLGSSRLLITHGHLFGVKRGLDKLLSAAQAERAQAALYGHTHIQNCEYREGVMLLNPGAAMAGHYALLILDSSGALRAELH